MMRKIYQFASLLLILLIGITGYVHAQGCQFSGTITGPSVVCMEGPYVFGVSLNNAVKPPYTYKWINGTTASSAKISFPNPNEVYTITVNVTDAGGCSVLLTKTVTYATYNLALSTFPACEGKDGYIQATVTAESDLFQNTLPEINIRWDELLLANANPAKYFTKIPGIYRAYVLLNGEVCNEENIEYIPIPNPVPQINGPAGVCNSGDIPIKLTVGPDDYVAYEWDPYDSTDSTYTTTDPGLYSVTVTDLNGCTGTDNITIGTLPSPSAQIIGPSVLPCFQDTAIFRVSPNFPKVEWSTGETTPQITAREPGLYSVTVTNNNGCTISVDKPLVKQTLPDFTILPSRQPFCPGDTITLKPGVIYPKFVWSNGDSVRITKVSKPGTYTVTVTNGAGCTATSSVVVSWLPKPNPVIIAPDSICLGAATTISAAGGLFPKVKWSTGDTLSNILISAPGAYSVTVTDTLGCRGNTAKSIKSSGSANIAITQQPYTCNGSLTLTATQNLLNYLWSTGQSTPSIAVSSTGAYSVTATGANGCTGTAGLNVQIPAPPAPQILGPSSICLGSNAQYSIAGSFSSYLWSTGATTPSVSVNQSGNYSVTVTDAFGCTGTATRSLSVGAGIVPVINELAYTCDRQRTLDAGSGFASYTWSTGASTPQVVVNMPGTYTVTVSDANGCTGTGSVQATIPPLPQPTVTGPSALCPGTATNLTAAAGFTLYSWSNGSLSATTSVNQPGTYGLTVTDAFGCTGSANAAIQALPIPTPQIAGANAICNGQSAQLGLANGPFETYLWSTGASTAAITANQAGVYTVTVTNTDGCTGTNSQTLTVNNNPTPVINTLPYTCNNQLGLQTELAYANYQWSDGQTAPTTTATANGLYSVVVTDNNGCTGSTSITVTIPAAPVVSISGPTGVCEGSTAVLTADNGFDKYAWSTGENGLQILIQQGGQYSVTVTDNNGCTAVAGQTIQLLNAPQPQISSPNAACSGTSVTLTLDQAYSTYSWSTGAATPQIETALPGTFQVTVTNSQGCTGTTSYDLAFLPAVVPVIAPEPYNCDSRLTLTTQGGFASYNWSNGSSANAILISSDGQYTVTVSDAAGCTGTASFTAQIPPPPTVAISGNTSLCENGSTTLTASSGFVSYAWSNGTTGQVLTVNQAGTYQVTATDVNGCPASAEVEITGGQLPPVNITGATAICPGQTTLLSATPGYASYSWSNGSISFEQTVSEAASYTVTVTSLEGCTNTATINITSLPTATVTVIGNLQICPGGGTVLTATPGLGSYVWSGGETSFQIIATNPGPYTVSVTNAAGCTSAVTVEVVQAPTPNVVISGTNSLCSAASAQLSVTAGLSSYSWSTGASTPEITITAPGTYSVTATGVNGCTGSASIEVTEGQAPSVAITGPATLCPGTSASLNATAALASYIWSTGDTTASVTVNSAGNYTVTVTNAGGCFGTASYTLGTGSTPVVAISGSEELCEGVSIELSATPGLSGYLWSTGDSTSSIQISALGVYSVTATNAAGCTAEQTITIRPGNPPSVSINGGASTILCEGSPAGVVLTATPSLASYLWSTGATTPSITVTTAGTYTVTATNAAGCTASASTNTVVANPNFQASAPGQLCAGSTLQLAASGGTQYVWSGPNGFTSTQANPSIPQIGENAGGKYTVVITDASTGCSTTRELTVNILPRPAITFILPLKICVTASPLNLVAAPLGGQFSGPGVTANSFSPAAAGVGTHTITYTVTGTNGCTATAVNTITVEICLDAPEVLGSTGGWNIFPNPTAGDLFLTQGGNRFVSALRIDVYNALGQYVRTLELTALAAQETRRLELQKLPAGAYTLRLTEKAGVFTLPFVVID